MRGVHFEEADEITIEGESSDVILDGETFRAEPAARSTCDRRTLCRSSSSRRKPPFMSDLRELVAEELIAAGRPARDRIARAIAAKHGAASRAVLFYGSCLRESELDGLMLDFYLIVSDYRAAYAKRWLATANRLIPPNVFYFEHDGLVAKYAVLSEADFAHECCPKPGRCRPRRASPSLRGWCGRRDQVASERIVDTVSSAAPTLLGWTRRTTAGTPLRSICGSAPSPHLRCRTAGGTSRPVGRDRRC